MQHAQLLEPVVDRFNRRLHLSEVSLRHLVFPILVKGQAVNLLPQLARQIAFAEELGKARGNPLVFVELLRDNSIANLADVSF